MPMRTMYGRITRLVSLVSIVGMIIFIGYRTRCMVFTCQPATWTDMLVIAQTQAAKAGSSYRIGSVLVQPTFQTRFNTNEPYDLTIAVQLISIHPDLSHESMFPERTIAFSDRDQWVTWRNLRAWTADLPALEAQQRLNRVRVSPRDAYQRTWNRARRALSSSIRLSAASLILYTNALPQERFGVESVWAVSYYDDHDNLMYWIDARTGDILQQTKERYRNP